MFKQKFHFINGETLELEVREKLYVPVFNGVVTVNGETQFLINLSQVLYIEVKQGRNLNDPK